MWIGRKQRVPEDIRNFFELLKRLDFAYQIAAPPENTQLPD
jgi:hypothetical protein